MNSEPLDNTELDSEVGPATQIFLGLCIVVCIAFGIWAAVGTLAVVSVAVGEVVPSTKVKAVQHLEGGIVREIHAHEGDVVTTGQPLISMEATASGADVGELLVRTIGLRIEVARLEAEIGGQKPVFPEDLMQSEPKLVQSALDFYNSRINKVNDDVATQEAIISQRRQDVREILARIKNQQETLRLLAEKVRISEELLKDDLTNRYNHLNLLIESNRLSSSVEEDRAALQRAQSGLAEAQSKLRGIRNGFEAKAREELEQARRRLDELTPRLAKHQDSLKRTVLRSPVDGVVMTVHIATVGGVLRPGDTVVDIVPADDRLVIEAKLRTQDIGYVRAGQPASIKLASSDAARFDNLTGNVVSVSPDTVVSPDGFPFYKVRIETERDHFRRGGLRYNLFPGMQVMASINTGQRTVLEYLFDPFLNAFDSALQER
jgi:adhesin transport system membrane fusion protein